MGEFFHHQGTHVFCKKIASLSSDDHLFFFFFFLFKEIQIRRPGKASMNRSYVR